MKTAEKIISCDPISATLVFGADIAEDAVASEGHYLLDNEVILQVMAPLCDAADVVKPLLTAGAAKLALPICIAGDAVSPAIRNRPHPYIRLSRILSI